MAQKKKLIEDEVVKKTTTEMKTLKDIFGNFETDYKSFVEWTSDSVSGNKFTVVEFIEDRPEKYTNKWSREQYKILCTDEYGDERYLSGGKRLFKAIGRLCMAENQLPTELGLVLIHRIGSGFDTKYRVEKYAL